MWDMNSPPIAEHTSGYNSSSVPLPSDGDVDGGETICISGMENPMPS